MVRVWKECVYLRTRISCSCSIIWYIPRICCHSVKLARSGMSYELWATPKQWNAAKPNRGGSLNRCETKIKLKRTAKPWWRNMAIVCRLVWHASSFPATFMTELKDKRMFEYKIKVSAFYPNTHASIYRFAAQPLLDSKHNAFAPWIDNHTGQAVCIKS